MMSKSTKSNNANAPLYNFPVPYSALSHAVYGDTSEIKFDLLSLGCKYNPNLRDGKGYILPNSKFTVVSQRIRELNAGRAPMLSLNEVSAATVVPVAAPAAGAAAGSLSDSVAKLNLNWNASSKTPVPDSDDSESDESDDSGDDTSDSDSDDDDSDDEDEHKSDSDDEIVQPSKKRKLDVPQSKAKQPLYTVRRVLEHDVSEDGEWSFLIEFSDGSKEWALDKDCECDIETSKYMNKHCLQTTFCVARVSSKNQVGDTHTSLADQVAKITDKIHSDPRFNSTYDRVKVVQITGSAYHDIPERLSDVGASCNRGDNLYVYRVDRLGRNIFAYISWLQDLMTRGVHVRSVEDNLTFNSSNENEQLDFLQKLINAHRESALISKRVRDSINFRLDRGDDTFGSVGYGFKTYRDERTNSLRVAVNVDELSVARYVMECDNHEEGVANKLNNNGYFKRGKMWTAASVRRLKNNKYVTDTVVENRKKLKSLSFETSGGKKK